MKVDIGPSAQARQVYGMMVTRADEVDYCLHLSLAHSIELSVVLNRRGEDPQAMTAVSELREADWIRPMAGGGWMIT